MMIRARETKAECWEMSECSKESRERKKEAQSWKQNDSGSERGLSSLYLKLWVESFHPRTHCPLKQIETYVPIVFPKWEPIFF